MPKQTYPPPMPTSEQLLAPLQIGTGAPHTLVGDIRVIPADQVPAPYHALLVHDTDMTSTLESHFEQPLRLQVLAKQVKDSILSRQVLLVGALDGVVTEFGAICIHLDRLDDNTRALVEACHIPLGGILREREVPFVSQPAAFLRIQPTPALCTHLRLRTPVPLYGRRNTLSTPAGQVMASIVEILPAIPATSESLP